MKRVEGKGVGKRWSWWVYVANDLVRALCVVAMWWSVNSCRDWSSWFDNSCWRWRKWVMKLATLVAQWFSNSWNKADDHGGKWCCIAERFVSSKFKQLKTEDTCRTTGLDFLRLVMLFVDIDCCLVEVVLTWFTDAADENMSVFVWEEPLRFGGLGKF